VAEKPDLFVTYTCNPKIRDIVEMGSVLSIVLT
jgi:hypothetical protein